MTAGEAWRRSAMTEASRTFTDGSFFFAASWIVYVLYLPQLAAQAGIDKAAVPWILMADQLVFVFADYASGVAADKVSRTVGAIGGWVLAATLVTAATVGLFL